MMRGIIEGGANRKKEGSITKGKNRGNRAGKGGMSGKNEIQSSPKEGSGRDMDEGETKQGKILS